LTTIVSVEVKFKLWLGQCQEIQFTTSICSSQQFWSNEHPRFYTVLL